jgi:DNA-binding response OmpR family regulator
MRRLALDSVQKHPPDLIILDVMLPDIDGLEVCRSLRQRDNSRRIPVIMLTARTEEIDRVVGFEVGADDYVMKPFSPARACPTCEIDFPSHSEDRSDVLRIGRIRLFPQRRQVVVGSRSITLTAKEFDLLQELMRARETSSRREMLMDKVWGYTATQHRERWIRTSAGCAKNWATMERMWKQYAELVIAWETAQRRVSHGPAASFPPDRLEPSADSPRHLPSSLSFLVHLSLYWLLSLVSF